MAELKDTKRKNGKLSLYPLKLDKAVKALLVVESKPPIVEKTNSMQGKGYDNGHQGNRT